MNGAALLLAELESTRLEVVLVPCRRFANVGGCIRVAASKNAPWYRRFGAQFGSDRRRRNRAFDTRIRRANVVSVLSRLADGKPSRSKYAPDLLRLAARLERQVAA